MRSEGHVDGGLLKAHFEAFQEAYRQPPTAVPAAFRDLQFRLRGLLESSGEIGHYGPHTDPQLGSTPLLHSVQSFSNDVTGLCRAVGEEDMFSYVPAAPPGAYLCHLSKEIT